MVSFENLYYLGGTWIIENMGSLDSYSYWLGRGAKKSAINFNFELDTKLNEKSLM